MESYLVDTGENSNTGGRLKYIKKYLKNNEEFCLTYGDGVGNINIRALLDFHKRSKKLCTMTSVKIPGRFGSLEFDKKKLIKKFTEKPLGDGGWINGGFFVFNKKIIDLIKKDSDSLVKDILPILVRKNQLMAFNHNGFWQAMDTMRDKNLLEEKWHTKNPPWKIW